MKKNIEHRSDIEYLVQQFYQKIQKDNVLGPVFNQRIQVHEWDTHIQKLTDFWETQLFSIPKFKGNPTQKHLETDAQFNYQIKENHFKRWLSIWQETIDTHYQGDLAIRAKMGAVNIAKIQQNIILRNKPI